MRKKISTALILLSLMLGLQACTPKVQTESYAGYLFAYFEGEGHLQEQLRFAVSRDARNWRALNGNRPIIASDTISESGGIRDPHILRGPDRCYYIVATDMYTCDPAQGWGSNPGIILMQSKDLIHWTHAKINLSKDFPEEFGDAYWVWAPQTIYDREAERLLIYFTLQRSDRQSLITYYAYANKEFTGFCKAPEELFSAKYGSIDNDIIEAPDGTYHLFYKGNTKDERGHEFKNGIQQATSKSIKGPWREDFVYLDAYADTHIGVEGSSVFPLHDGSGEWILMYDLYGSGRYEYQISKDLYHFTEKPQSFTKDFFPRHGSVISITEEELQRLQQEWGEVL